MKGDRFVHARRDVAWGMDIEHAMHKSRMPYQCSLRETLMPNASVFRPSTHAAPVEPIAAMRDIMEVARLDAPGCGAVRGERLCDWGAVNDELIVWVCRKVVDDAQVGTVYARNMETQQLRSVATFTTGGRVKAVRWSPRCSHIGMATDEGVACIDAGVGRKGWSCTSTGPATTLEWRDDHIAASCTPSGVDVYDVRVSGGAVVPLKMASACTAVFTDHGIAVAGGEHVAVYDMRRCARSLTVLRASHDSVVALDWAWGKLAVGTLGGEVSVMRSAGMEPVLCTGSGLVGIMWGPRGRGLATLSRDTHLVAHCKQTTAQAHCIGDPCHLVHNGDRTRAVVMTHNEVAMVFNVFPPHATPSRAAERRGLIR